MPDRHALLGPSGAHKWLVCPGSARLEETYPGTTSIHAEKGRLAHEIAELKLLKYITPMPTRTYNSKLKKLKETIHPEFGELYEPALDPNTDVYLDYIKRISLSYKETPYIMSEQEVDFSEYVPEAFGTSDCIILGSSVLHVIDYKNGSGVYISPYDNPQMKLYALGAYLKYGMLYAFDTVRMSIVQPNIVLEPEMWECSLTELLEWADSIKDKAQKAWDGVQEFTAGEHCRFCSAKAQCRANRDKALEAEGFQIIGLPPLLSDAEVGEALNRSRTLSAYIKALEEYALSTLLSGGEIPGWKAVEGRSIRRFTDIDGAFEAAKSAGIAKEILYEMKPITLSQLEKVMGAKEFSTVIGKFVEKPPGSPALVDESDKRPAVTLKTSAEEDFKDGN